MSDNIEIQVSKRSQGRSQSRSLRQNNKIPAVIYGPKMKNILISVPELIATKYAQQEFSNTILTLKSEDKEINGLKVLRKDLTVHPVSRRPVHIDYYAMDMTQTIRVSVKIDFKGTALGEKEGGVFNIIRREVEIECLPINIPEMFSVDISQLDLNQSLAIADLNISDKYNLITTESETIATVAQVKEEAEEKSGDDALQSSGEEVAAAATSTPEPGKKKEGDSNPAANEKKPEEK